MTDQAGLEQRPPFDGPRLRVAWVTNVSAPYRHPVWRSLATAADLRVGLLAANEPNRQWTSELPTEVPRLKTRTFAVHRSEFHLYGLFGPVLGLGFDVVVLPGWESPAAWQLLAEAKARRVATVGFYESAAGTHRFSSGPIAAARRRFFRSVDVVLTVGAASEEAVLEFGVPREQIVTTHNTVDVEAIHAAGFRASAGVAERAHRFVYVGQLIHRKNVDGLLDAFATLPPNARLVVAGEGPENAALQAQSRRLGVADRVEFRGYVPYDKVPVLMSEASTLVLPSRSEVYGLVVMEALAAGLQVVVAQTCGVYADVHDLPGVYPAEPTSPSLAGSLRRSAEAWSGPLDQPAILARTPQAMANDVLRACVVARSRR